MSNRWNWVASLLALSSQNSIVSHRSLFMLCIRQRFINQVYIKWRETSYSRSYLRLTPGYRIAVIFSANNPPPNRHFCMEKTASRTFMTWLRPKVGRIRRVPVEMLTFILCLQNQDIFQTKEYYRNRFFFVFCFALFSFEFSLSPWGEVRAKKKFRKLVSSTTRVFRCVYLMYVSSVHIVTSRGNKSPNTNPLPDGIFLLLTAMADWSTRCLRDDFLLAQFAADR